MSKTIETFIVDSFTSEVFKGNPAGVCLLENPRKESEMLSIAKELGFSETAFILQKEGSSERFTIRFFSPKMEIPLCGHATIAASRVLFRKNPQLNQIQFETIEDLILSIAKEDEEIVMQFPLYSTAPAEAPAALLEALGIAEFLNCEYNAETNILLIEIKSSRTLRRLAPDFNKLIHSHKGINGVLVTANSDSPSYDFESRYFWPWSGTTEDPVTGGTHTFLTPYWAQRLNKTTMKSFQCSERSGSMTVSITPENGLLIKANAIIVFEGKMFLD